MKPKPPSKAKKQDDSREGTKKTDRSDSYFSRMVDYIPDALITTDDQYVVISWNAAAEHIYGWKAEEVIGKSLNGVLQTNYQNTDQDEAARTIRETGTWSGEVSQLRKDGTCIPIWSSVSVIKYEEGHPVGFICVNRDITERKRVEDALRESEEKYSTLFNKLAVPAVLLKLPEVVIVDANEAFQRLVGYSLKEIQGRTAVELGITTRREREQAIDRFEKNGNLAINEGRITTRSGEERVVVINTNSIEFGGQRYAVTSVNDITERKQAEEALRESEEKFSIIFRKAPFAAALSSTPDLRLLEINDAFESLWGYSAEEVIGKTSVELGMFPDDNERERLSTVFREQGFLHNAEIKLRAKSGSLFDILINTDGVKIGNVQYLLTTVQDITERKRAEETLKESEERFHKVFEEGPIGMVLTSRDLKFFSANPAFCQMLGYTAGEMNSKTFLDVTHPDHREIDRENVEKMWQGEIPHYRTQKRYIAKNGDIRWGSLSTSLIQGQDGTPLYALAMVEDITERKRAEDALATSEAELRALFASMQDVVLVIDREGVYRKIAPTNPGLLYKPPQELLGQNLRDVFSAEQAETFVGVIRQTLDTGQTTRVEYELAIGEHSIWFSTSISPMDADSTLWVAHDITKKKQAETEIRRRADEFAALYNTSMNLSAEHDSNTLLQTIVENAAIMLNAYAGGMYLYDPVREELEVTFTTDPSMPVGTRLRLGEGVAGRVAQTQQSMRIEDYSTWEGRSQKYEGIDVRATIEVPMLYKGELIGVLVAHETGASERQFTEADEHLLSLFASQAAAAIQNNRLLEQERQRVTELEMLYESGLALSRLSNLKEIGQKIIELLDQKMNWHHTTIRQYHPENETLELLAFNQPGLSSEQEKRAVEERFRTIITKKGQGLSGWVIEHGQGVRTSDLINDARYIDTYPGLRSGLYVPIKLGEHIIGVISIESEKSNAFSEADERLATTLANQAASALENARLFEQERARARELSTLYDAAKMISSDLALESVLETVAEKMAQILHSDGCTLSILNRERDALVTLADCRTKHPDRAESKNAIYYLNKYPATRRILESGQPLVINPKDKKADQSELAHMTERGITTLLMLPLIAHDQIIGLAEVYEEERERTYKQEEIQLLQSLAAQAAISIENARLFDDAQHRLRKTKALREIDRAITGSTDMQHVLKIVLKHTINELGVDAAVILLYDPIEQSLHYELGSGFRADSLQHTRLRLGQGYAGRAAMGKQTIYIPDLRVRSTDFLRSPTFHQEGFICYFGVPLIAKGEIMGVLEIFHRAALNPDIEWLSFMETLAGQIAIAIDNATLYKNLQHSNKELSLAYDATIEGWSRALDLRDRETEGHTLRVTELTKQMAKEMGMNEEELVHIQRGALLHDIGKMGVPDRILLKPDTLTDEEWKIMQKHPVFAYEMLSSIGFLLPALDIPYCHHEKWDGTGYPRKLKGDEIPLVARIFAVVDVWDALTSNRPYRPAWTKEQTLEHIREQSGKHFDPNVVEVFLRSIAEE